MTERDADLNALVDGSGPVGARIIGLHTLAKEARDEIERLHLDWDGWEWRPRAEAAERDLAEARAALERIAIMESQKGFGSCDPNSDKDERCGIGWNLNVCKTRCVARIARTALGSGDAEEPALRKEGENTNG